MSRSIQALAVLAAAAVVATAQAHVSLASNSFAAGVAVGSSSSAGIAEPVDFRSAGGYRSER